MIYKRVKLLGLLSSWYNSVKRYVFLDDIKQDIMLYFNKTFTPNSSVSSPVWIHGVGPGAHS